MDVEVDVERVVETVTRGDPAALERYTREMTGRVAVSRAPLAGYAAAMARLLSAPSELPVPIPDRSWWIAADLDDLERLDRQPALFASALRAADHLAALATTAARTGGIAPLLDRVRRLLLDPAGQARSHAEGRRLAVRLLAASAADTTDEARLRHLAAVLAGLDEGDPAMIAGFYGTVGAEGLLRVLAATVTAVDRTPDGRGPEDLTGLLEPLGVSFANAARLTVIDAAFVSALLADTTAGNGPDGGRTRLVALLLLYGDPWSTGNAALTADLASMVLADGFQEATRHLGTHDSPWRRASGDPLADGAFHVEAQVTRAATALIDLPSAAHGYLLEPGNQRALLDRAGEGWWLGAADGASRILEGGLLQYPLENAILGDGWAAGSGTVRAVQALVDEVAGRARVDASISRGLANVLAPHLHSVERTVSRNAVGEDLLRRERGVIASYLANTLRHEAGAEALTGVFAAWTRTTFAHWATWLVPQVGALLPVVDSRYVLDLDLVHRLYTLFEEALAQTRQRYVDDRRLLYFAVREADRVTRSALPRELGWGAGPKGRLASEALSRAASEVTDTLLDRIDAAGPGTVDDLRDVLDDQLPNLAIATAIAAVPEDRFDELVPVAPSAQPREVEGSFYDRHAPWRDPTSIVQVELADWDQQQRDAWIRSSMEVLRSRGADDREATLWWLNMHMSVVELPFGRPSVP